TSDGGYVVAGATLSFGVGCADIYIIKTDSQGNTGPYPPTPLSPQALKGFKPKGSPLNKFFLFPFNR
ncbi:MAG: hypothetical protein ABDH25_01455, partial [Dictyoglomaceae bacterium]